MENGTVVTKGIVQGKTVTLEDASGLPDGQAVTVILRPAFAPGRRAAAGIRSWADDSDELDRFVNQVYQDREDDRPGPTA